MRYGDRAIEEIWSDGFKYAAMIEMSGICMVTQANTDRVYESRNPSLYFQWMEKAKKLEEKTRHDVAALIDVLRVEFARDYPDEVKYLHHHMTSSDLVDTAYSKQMQESCQKISTELDKLYSAIKGSFNAKVFTAGRTHGKVAQPIYLSHRGDVYSRELLISSGNLMNSFHEFPVKLSGPMGDSRGILFQQTCVGRVAKRFRLTGNVLPTSQIITRSLYSKSYQDLDRLAGFLRKLATDLRLLAASGIEEWSEGFTKGQKGSSSMPHKRNPVRLERVCGLSRVVQANCRVMTDVMDTWLERDISNSSVERVVPPLVWGLSVFLVKEMADILETGQWDFIRMAHNCPLNDTNARYMELVKSGVDPEKAYRQIQDEGVASLHNVTV